MLYCYILLTAKRIKLKIKLNYAQKIIQILNDTVSHGYERNLSLLNCYYSNALGADPGVSCSRSKVNVKLTHFCSSVDEVKAKNAKICLCHSK